MQPSVLLQTGQSKYTSASTNYKKLNLLIVLVHWQISVNGARIDQNGYFKRLLVSFTQIYFSQLTYSKT